MKEISDETQRLADDMIEKEQNADSVVELKRQFYFFKN